MASRDDDDIAFGAVPGSGLDPTTVQAMLQNVYAAQQEGGYPDIRVPDMPEMVRMPGLPAVRVIEPPRAPIQGFLPPEGPRAMVGGAQMPGLMSLSGLSASGLSGTGSRSGSSSGTSSGTSSGGLGSARGGAQGLAGSGGGGIGNLLTSLIRPLMNRLGQQSGRINWPDIGPAAGTVSGGFDYEPLGGTYQDLGPLGTGAQTNTAPDILRPIFGSESYPQDFPNEWEGDLTDLFSGSPDEGTGITDIIDLFSGSPDEGTGVVDILNFAGDPESGLAGSFGEDVIGSLGGDESSIMDALGGLGLGDVGLGDVVPYLRGATGLLNLGTGIASGDPSAVVNPIKDLGMAALNMSGILPSAGAGIPIAAAAAIVAQILTDELQDPGGRVSAVQDANYLNTRQLEQGATILRLAPAILDQVNDQMTDEELMQAFQIGRAGMKSAQLASDPLVHQGQRDAGAQYANFGGMAALVQRNGPIAAQVARRAQDLLVARGFTPEDFRVPQVGTPGGNDSPFAPFYGTLYTPEGNAGEYNNPDLSPNQLAQVMNRQADLASGGYEGRMQGIPGGTLFLTPEDWAIWGL